MFSYLAPPKITTHPSEIEFINEGDNVTLNCIAIGYPLPSVMWIKGSTSLQGTQLFQERGKGTRLHFKNITYEEKGKYTCIAKNAVGMASFDVKVIFKGTLHVRIASGSGLGYAIYLCVHGFGSLRRSDAYHIQRFSQK